MSDQAIKFEKTYLIEISGKSKGNPDKPFMLEMADNTIMMTLKGLKAFYKTLKIKVNNEEIK